MKIYLVGGAVRDQLLKRTIKEKDWVVVGASVADMLEKNFKQVGKDFPVFLHPTTKEEYALARVERKVGRGYTGFTFDTSPNVTLEEDLIRRDLTINAIAFDPETNTLIDPYHGQADLKNKILRHVSEAFIEDPVRILRVARFAARFHDFTVADETTALMQKMVASGEIDALVAERVWKECERALQEDHTEKFFAVLKNAKALTKLFPEKISLQALMQAANDDPKIKFAALFHALSEAEIKQFCERYRVPSEYRDLALLVANHIESYKKASILAAEDILAILQATDAFRREERFKRFLTACEIVSRSKQPTEFWLQCYAAIKAIDMQEILRHKPSGKEIEKQIREARLKKIAALIEHL